MKDVIRTYKGLHKDNSPIDQAEGTYRFALNAINQTKEGDENFLSIEPGFDNCFDLPEGFVIIGNRYLGDERTVIFSTDNTSSEIGILHKGCKYSVVKNDPCLGFNTNFPIDVTYRVREGCKDIVYFTDDLNPLRVMDLGNPPDDCEELNLFRNFIHPCMNVQVRDTGGVHEVGTYQITFRYLDEDDNATDWISVALPVKIYQERTTDEYRLIDGGYTDEVDPVAGLLPTSKSIAVELSNLDTNFTGYQIGVASSTSGTGIITEFLISPRIPISRTIYTISGTYDGWTAGSVEEVQVGNLRADRAKHIEQLENRLILANITEEVGDYCTFQSFANQVEVTYVTKSVPKKEIVDGNPKNPEYGEHLSLMGDEIYPYSIHYVLENGKVTPGFHIPGREANANDLEILTVVSGVAGAGEVNIDEVHHLGLIAGNTVERWKVFNTANSTTKEMAYYECDTLYPTDVDCDGEPIYGDLAGTPIRHHRLPCRQIEPHFDSDNIILLGAKFDNVIYPPGIVGHIITRGIRTPENRTIQDKGVVWRVWRSNVDNSKKFVGQLEGFFDFDEPTTLFKRNITWISPNNTFNQELVSGSYFKFENEMHRIGTTSYNEADIAEDNGISIDLDDFLGFSFKYFRFDDFAVAPGFTNAQIIKTALVPSRVTVPFGADTIFNQSFSIDLSVYDINRTLPYDLTSNFAYYAAIKNNISVFCNLETIEYVPMHNCVLTGTNELFGGDTTISPLVIHNEYKETIRRNIFGSIKGYIIDGCMLSGMYIESDINMAMRHDGIERCEKYFKPTDLYLESQANPSVGAGFDFMYNLLTEDIGEDLPAYAGMCKNFFGYNPDYLVQVRPKLYFPIDFTTFDCCSECTGEFPNRVIWSQQSFQEERTDTFRTFLGNNYSDIEASHGPITDLLRYNNNLYIFSTDAVWLLPQNIQERITDEIVSFVGTGEFFAIPPRLLMDTDIGITGCIDKYATIKTPQGVFWIDSNASTPHLLGSQLASIDTGMKNWLEENMTNTLRTFLEEQGVEYPLNTKVGAIAAYDARFDRILLTYKDYELTSKFAGVTSGRTGTSRGVWFDSTANEFYEIKADDSIVDVSFTDPKKFCDKSWTLSYSLQTGAWVSFHSYIPDWYIHTKKEVYSSEGSGVWKHNGSNFRTYYGKQYPHIIEYVSAPSPETKIWDDLTIMSQATENNLDKRFVTFDQLRLYNSYQTTGPLTLVQRDLGENLLVNRTKDTFGSVDITRSDRNWYINSFRSHVNTYEEPIYDYDCIDFRVTDKNFNTITSAIDWTERMPMEDKFLIVRLSFNGPNTINLTTNYTAEEQQKSEK